MEKFRIRRTSSDHVGAINHSSRVNVGITSTSRKFLHGYNQTNIKLDELFMEERENCKNYRVILSLKPYCTNVLFNPCTEITYTNDKGELCSVNNCNPASCAKAIGKTDGLTACDMVRNTEYSSEKLGFEYHPGLDIFNNHILRNKSYRIVNRLGKNKDRDVFNTISDYFRLQDGTRLKKCNRLDVSDTTMGDKHLYNADDILSFQNGDAVKENLKEDNGWFGFYNTSTIDAKDESGYSLDINRVINNKSNCQFIDMYPDRTLFSFSPIYNKLRGRVEYNWDIVLTYPFEHTTKLEDNTDIHVIESDGQNGLFIVDAKMYHINNGGWGMLFRTLTKHNLNPGDAVHMYYNKNRDSKAAVKWDKIDGNFIIHSIGDEHYENKEYYFTITDINLLDSLFCTQKEDNTSPKWWEFFYKQLDIADIQPYNPATASVYKLNELVVKDDELYICTEEKTGEEEISGERPGRDDKIFAAHFTKLDEICRIYDTDGPSNFPSYNDGYIKICEKIGENGEKYYVLYNKDTSQSFVDVVKKMSAGDFIIDITNTAFRIKNDGDIPTDGSVGLWNDYISFRMVKVVGGIECEYYVRKFKKIPNINNKELYKLAFASTIYGDDIAQVTYTDTLNVEGLVDNRGRDISEIYATIIKSNRGYEKWYMQTNDADYNDPSIEASHCFGPVTCGFDFHTQSNDNKNIRDKRLGDYDIHLITNDFDNINKPVYKNLKKNLITFEDEWYYGDIVEFSPYMYEETILCDVNFRFNTAQREMNTQSPNKLYTFEYDEFVTDDYDSQFKVETKEITLSPKHEGYYYKAHYKLKIRALSPLQQLRHRQVFVDTAEPYQSNGIFIKITSRTNHHLIQGDKLILTDTVNNIDWILSVITTPSKYSAIITKIDKADANYRDWVTTCMALNDKTYIIRKLDETIPDYAVNIGTGTYVWRNTVGLWEEDSENSLVYANNALYIDDCINFYLKRQNSDNNNPGMIIKNEDVIMDIEGEQDNRQSNYDYIDEEDITC